MRLRSEVAIVTGATAGIGAAIAGRFAAEGASVAVTGRDEARGARVAQTIIEAGGSAAFFAADLVDEHACAHLVDRATARFGSLTVLVNNAVMAGARDGAVGDLATDAWENTFRINVTAPMWLCRAAIPAMLRAGHGAIVNISSRAAEQASPRLAAYIASKGALNALTRSLAVDYASRNIRANTISPGYVLNERRDAGQTAEERRRREGMHLTRLGVADDVAHAAVYLASREAEFVTGANLALDGGSSAARGLVLG
ncbi:MAG: SDR family oxidoreductase [Acidimicrobiia bacterium]